MQVDPKPSPWPCVVMLVGLLLVCLTVPHYWQEAPDTPLGGAELDILPNGSGEPFATWLSPRIPDHLAALGDGALGNGFDEMLNTGPLTLGPTPTIEQLVESARLGAARYEVAGISGNAYAIDWPAQVLPKADAPRADFASPQNRVGMVVNDAELSSPLLAGAMERVGQVMAIYSVAEAMPRWISQAVDWYRAQLPEPTVQLDTERNNSTWRLVPREEETVVPLPPAAAMQPVLRIPFDEPKRVAESPPAPQAATDPWCVPHTLYEQLERLASHPLSAGWANSTIAQLHAITELDPDDQDVSILLHSLSRSAKQAEGLAESTGEDRLRVELLRAHWGLARRLDCWSVAHDMRVAQRTGIRIAARGSLSQLFPGGPAESAGGTEELLLTSELESYEQSRDPQLGRLVAEQRQALEASPNALDQSMADAVERHYRNANVRVAIKAELINRLIGQQRSELRPVRDRIAGTPVRGQSVTVSQSRVRLEPANGYWQLGVEAQGVVESDTLANGGRARVRSFGATDFTAQKRLMVGADGVHLEPTAVDATNYSRLAGVTTDFDWVPLFGSYARSRAVQEYRARRRRAKAEVEYKVAAQAVDEVDRETLEAVDRVQRKVRERLTGPLSKFGIELTPIELTTTHERMVARMRVAGSHQLGAHTPRPRALSDSLASVQIHESALTNAAVGLALDGGRYTAAELQTVLRAKFPRMASANPPQAGDDSVFEFAYRDAVRFRIEDGHLELMLSLANFEHEGRATRDFIVHAFYAPVADGLSAELVRIGALGIEGRLSSTERARLHNAFKRVLSEDRRLPIGRLQGAGDDPRLAGLMITQMVLEDGWIGVAIGPGGASRVAERSRSLR